MREEKGEGQHIDAHSHGNIADANQKSEEGQRGFADSQVNNADLGLLISQIRYWHRQRCYAMEQRKRADLSLGSHLRTVLGWSHALPEAERKRIKERAKALAALGEVDAKGKPVNMESDYAEHQAVILATIAMRAPIDKIEGEAEKEMDQLGRQLPIWPWWEANVFSSKATSLSIIVAEAGDLSNYASHSKLWKRMCVAVIDGHAQGRPGAGATDEDWINEGYSPRRRSRMWNIGDALIKSDKGQWRECYLARKEYERKRAEANGLTVAPSAKIPAKRKAEFMSEGHIHRRAQRYMEKRLLKHLWQVWHGH